MQLHGPVFLLINNQSQHPLVFTDTVQQRRSLPMFTSRLGAVRWLQGLPQERQGNITIARFDDLRRLAEGLEPFLRAALQAGVGWVVINHPGVRRSHSRVAHLLIEEFLERALTANTLELRDD